MHIPICNYYYYCYCYFIHWYILYLFREGLNYYQTSPQVCPYVASLECPSPLWADDISIEASLVFLARSIFRHITPSSRSPRNIQFPTSKKYRLFPCHMAHPFLFPQKKQSLVGGWATQKLFSSIWIILFKRGKFQDIFKRPLLIKHGLLENSVQYSIDDVSTCFPAVNFINFPTSKPQIRIQRHRSQGLNWIGPEDVVNPAVFAPAQLQLSQGSPNGTQFVQIPAAIPHTTVNA